jgi:hypothetical protein
MSWVSSWTSRLISTFSTVANRKHWERGLLGVFLAVWTVALAALIGLLPTAGLLDLTLYQLYGIAAALGWVAGNVYVSRSRRFPRPVRSRILLIYLLGPPGILYLLRSLASPEVQSAAPLAAIYSCAVFFVFFLVPVTLKGSAVRSSRN